MSKALMFFVAFLLGVSPANASQAPEIPDVPRATVRPDDVRVIQTPPRETLEQLVYRVERQEVIDNADKCREWAGLAYDIGWPKSEIPRLLKIMHRESRCLPNACSESDSGRVCRDWGLMQINDHSWKRTITGQGYVMSDMWNPEHNLRFALWLYRYSEDRNGDGWQPWKITDKPT